MKTAIQFGTYKGNDDFYEEIKDQEFDLIVLIEPQTEYNDKIKECYKDLDGWVLENIAIDPDPSKDFLELWICHCLTSQDIKHILKHHPSQRVEFEGEQRKVPCLSPTQLFEKYNLTTIDFLSIDTEGMDETIINSLDFDRFKIKKIDYERSHIDDSRVEEFLKSKGYIISRATPSDALHPNHADANTIATLNNV